MKNLIILFIAPIVLFSCGSDSEPEPATGVVYANTAPTQRDDRTEDKCFDRQGNRIECPKNDSNPYFDRSGTYQNGENNTNNVDNNTQDEVVTPILSDTLVNYRDRLQHYQLQLHEDGTFYLLKESGHASGDYYYQFELEGTYIRDNGVYLITPIKLLSARRWDLSTGISTNISQGVERPFTAIPSSNTLDEFRELHNAQDLNLEVE
ncbi:hypothetical protein KMW28_27220 [Flammeovirga yaeyamensis]|uniref:Lipoprotein n=1 Tax=Flammeovirga yaeyamensis TaxID=367791 RepID=A0AAX1NBL9_9BACT|nr:hypothetical protein [Flammeovirga yaeyamensis]MBB3700028.1 hypothetical protein [Flammeovirga yaeyamensis]NMF37535.1 hypothetical protein [Flammeovirga yaeyamensis]QWG04592.1 hypothetical protein KMW28_27220 [Flammeovirga yaeyamensis]